MGDYNGEYKNIQSVETLENGLLTVNMKNGRQAIVEIIKLNEKFQAAVYSLFTPELCKSKKTLLKKLEKYDAYKECAKDALGWIDDNEFEEVVREEIKFGGK